MRCRPICSTQHKTGSERLAVYSTTMTTSCQELVTPGHAMATIYGPQLLDLTQYPEPSPNPLNSKPKEVGLEPWHYQLRGHCIPYRCASPTACCIASTLSDCVRSDQWTASTADSSCIQTSELNCLWLHCVCVPQSRRPVLVCQWLPSCGH